MLGLMYLLLLADRLSSSSSSRWRKQKEEWVWAATWTCPCPGSMYHAFLLFVCMCEYCFLSPNDAYFSTLSIVVVMSMFALLSKWYRRYHCTLRAFIVCSNLHVTMHILVTCMWLHLPVTWPSYAVLVYFHLPADCGIEERCTEQRSAVANCSAMGNPICGLHLFQVTFSV